MRNDHVRKKQSFAESLSDVIFGLKLTGGYIQRQWIQLNLRDEPLTIIQEERNVLSPVSNCFWNACLVSNA